MKLPGNMQAMMKQAEQMQRKMQDEIALIRVEASAGGGMVSIKMDGKKNVMAVKIDPEVAGDVEMLQDMVMAAFNEAAKKVDDAMQGKMGGLLGGMGLAARTALMPLWRTHYLCRAGRSLALLRTPFLNHPCPTTPNPSPD